MEKSWAPFPSAKLIDKRRSFPVTQSEQNARVAFYVLFLIKCM
jgi:hypothetical protein